MPRGCRRRLAGAQVRADLNLLSCEVVTAEGAVVTANVETNADREHYAQLVELKNKHDLTNFFSINQNVRPGR